MLGSGIPHTSHGASELSVTWGEVACESHHRKASVAALTVEVPAEEFDRAVDQAWRGVAGRVNIPGFRRGKAPAPW